MWTPSIVLGRRKKNNRVLYNVFWVNRPLKHVSVGLQIDPIFYLMAVITTDSLLHNTLTFPQMFKCLNVSVLTAYFSLCSSDALAYGYQS